MLRSFVSRFITKTNEKVESLTRRTFTRHETDRCIATIRGKTFKVSNWSFGGIELAAEDDIFVEGQPVSMTLKFKLSNSDLEIMHQGVIIRSYNGRTSIKFDELKHSVTRGLQQVIDDTHKRKLMEKAPEKKPK